VCCQLQLLILLWFGCENIRAGKSWFDSSPVPSYNWTRRGAGLPKSAIAANYNRVLIIPRVQVEDQGEYVCRATNEKTAIEHSVVLNIQGKGLMCQLLTCVCVCVCVYKK
jgi:hypothetical protein